MLSEASNCGPLKTDDAAFTTFENAGYLLLLKTKFHQTSRLSPKLKIGSSLSISKDDISIVCHFEKMIFQLYSCYFQENLV